MADVRAAERLVRDAADRDDAAAARELARERQARLDLAPASARRFEPLVAGMRRHDVPEQHVVREPELAEHAVDDRRRRLGRARRP